MIPILLGSLMRRVAIDGKAGFGSTDFSLCAFRSSENQNTLAEACATRPRWTCAPAACDRTGQRHEQNSCEKFALVALPARSIVARTNSLRISPGEIHPGISEFAISAHSGSGGRKVPRYRRVMQQTVPILHSESDNLSAIPHGRLLRLLR